MTDILITNNSLCANLSNFCTVDLSDISLEQVLEKVRDYVHLGHKLLTHPLSGSVKPNETPFKSVLVSGQKATLDLDSLNIIEGSISTAKKFEVKFKSMSEQMKTDFKQVDYALISNALRR